MTLRWIASALSEAKDSFRKLRGHRDMKDLIAALDERVAQDLPLSELGLGRQYTELLAANGMTTAGDFIQRLQEVGDEGLVEIRGIGRKVLTDAKKKLRARGYELPTVEA